MKVPNPLLQSLLLLALWASHFPAEAKSPRDLQFRIGFIYPRTGPLAPYGQSLSDGLKLGLQQFRDENPQLGHQIGVVVADDGSLASEAEKATERLIKTQKVHIIIGSISNTVNQAIAKEAGEKQTLLVLPHATDESLLGDALTFSLSPSDRRQGRMLARFALKQLRRDKAVILLDSATPDGEMIAKGFSEFFDQNGGQTLGQWTLEGGKTQLPPLMQEIARLQPQVIIFPGSYRSIKPLMDAARKAGIKATWIGGDGWDHAELLRLNEDIGAQYFASYFHTSDPQAGVQNFVADFEAAYGRKPDALASRGYEAVRVVLQAFASARSTDRTNLARAIEGGHYAPIYFSGRFAKDKVYLRPMPFLVTSGGQARFMSRIDLEE